MTSGFKPRYQEGFYVVPGPDFMEILKELRKWRQWGDNVQGLVND